MQANPSARSLADQSAVWVLPQLTERLVYAQQHQLPRLRLLTSSLTVFVEGESLWELCSMLDGVREAVGSLTLSNQPTRWWARSDKHKKLAAQEEAVSTMSVSGQNLGECVAAFQETSKRQQHETRIVLVDLLLEIMELKRQSARALQQLDVIYQDLQTRLKNSPPPVVKDVLLGLLERARALRPMLDIQNEVCIAARRVHEGCTRVMMTRTDLVAVSGRKVCVAQTELSDALQRLALVQTLHPKAEKLRKLMNAKTALTVQVEEAAVYLGEVEEGQSYLQKALTALDRNMTKWQLLSPNSIPNSEVTAAAPA